jgi:hypothetical protein
VSPDTDGTGREARIATADPSGPDTAGSGDRTAGTDPHGAWAAVLTELETALAAADAVGVAPVTWTEPTGLGPVPRELVGRASRLVAAQRDAIARAEATRRGLGDHLGALRTVDATREPERAVYLDATA